MRLILLVLCLHLLTGPAAAEAPRVVASIKPIHALVAQVMGDTGAPRLIVDGSASPHTYSLTPSDAAALEAADLVFWSGHGLELFLEDSLAALAPGAVSVALSQSPGLQLLPVREGGAFEAHGHGHDEAEDHEAHGHEHEAHEEHGHDGEQGQADMHYWLDPDNARLMLGAIAETLAATDPARAATYRANAATAATGLGTLAAEIDAALAPVRGRPFIVFHDAYQYFERRFGLTVAGSVTVSPEVTPGARRIGELRGLVRAAGAACIFAEPQFEPAVVATIAEGTGARTGVLDPEGAGVAAGPGAYADLLRGLARGLLDCLAG